ncbi:MAG TPA: quinol oxidase subunit 4 [Chitinophagaceae bacterium]|nr:quinol oxidase subunit 4 [Chitinophagaceae bacterium]
MKKVIFLAFLLGSIIASSCTHHHHSNSGGLPPGQAKKVTGSKSAKPYAPGQQKKH